MAEITVMNDLASCKKKGLFSRAMQAVKSVPSVLNNRTAKALVKYVAMPLAVWMVARGMAHADDLTAAGRQDAEDTFGSDSTMMYYFMLAEVVLVFLLYLKTHNPATFLLIPVFIVVTKIIFAIVAARSGA
ncbi:type IV conjugative transfer system pilin TraA [Klebsiella aerogenes]|uniref:type IV conjugative transfer system pilin TraA n=1 Tax=Klebsiella aerogenes TaxID=548 RepID=UPI000DA231E0|nr:type IV conjugative transfer system pilin TraA [Klebsiella aerogenes]HCB2859853.1 conjugal transfer protein TraA [Klebsiella aerogenes]HCB2864856.1 conjugal transfer protein TraA [Klebsiella aerogenes]HCB2880472.1 conjugal transfer protein TraA [Klebsiella aerogenes]HCB3345919.1 conjugal transfer protein TraA [Klebsiella aerogenes]HCM1811921.1 conjugal transfer protein TraA [Klebsiella aerogenes]